ncbi:ephrin type-A receptor 1 [Anolis carolinensis]|uniref:ephrin type-A receptor 1 n=1 Tax=Anolis carolinensis TaxID=28377 RepID=UPI002F2B853A
MGALLGAESGSSPKLLAVVVILSVCFLSTEAFLQLTNIKMEPSEPKEGGSVRLTPNNLPPVPLSCRWYRSEMSNNCTILIRFFYPRPMTRKESSFTGHETMRSDCSLEIKNLKANDSENYIVLIHGRDGIRIGSMKLAILVNLLDTSTAQNELGWLPDPSESGWSETQHMINGTPVYMYQDCSVLSEGDTDHWLRTNWIIRDVASSNIFVELKFTIRDCKSFKGEVVSCKETFNLYYMESDNDVGIQFRRPLFTKINTVAGDRSFTARDIASGDMQLNMEVSSIEKLHQRGFYLAFQNSGACVALVSVRVYYKTCSESVHGLAHFPETLASSEGLETVFGTCLKDAAEKPGFPPKMHCSSNGEWLLPMGQCICVIGFEEVEGACVGCQPGFYRHSLETEKCLKCPPNSFSSSPAATACPCHKGFFRTPTEDQTIACTRPPSAPHNVTSSLVGSQVSLTWQPPIDQGGRSDLSYNVSCKRCHFLVCEPCGSDVVFSPRALGLTRTNVVVDGLESYTNYSFTVRAYNGVSGLSSASHKSTSSSVWVTVGYADPIIVTNINLDSQNESSLSVTWLPTRHRSHVPISYEVMYFEKGEEKHYTVQHLKEPKVTLANLQPDTSYLLRVRSVTPSGEGPFSQEQEFRTLPQETGIPSGGMIVCIIFGILLFIGLVGGLIILRRRQAHRRARPCQKHSSYNRDDIWLKPYVDLQPYEDPSRGVLEFTKELDPSLVNIENVIGEGEFGEVYRGSLRFPGKDHIVVAIKTLKSSYSDSTWWNFLREATIMGQFNHPNIVRLEGVVTKRNPMMIITEYMDNGALDNFLRENMDKFSAVQLVIMLQGIASGMTYLSDRNYVHRDLAARNILVSHSHQCKVSDFGLSRILENDVEGTYETKGGKIPIRWTAPEAIAHRIFTSASDVWSFGIVMWEVFSYGDKPYGDMSNQEVMKSIEDGYRLPPPVDCPSVLYELMKACWSYDRARRPRFREIQAQLDHFISSPHLLRSVADFDPRVTLRLPSCSGSDGIPYRSIPEWLESIRMKRYILNFRTAGLNTMESVLELTAEDLKQMGVTLPGHQKRILCSIQGFKE